MSDDLRALPIGYVVSDYRIDGVLGHGGFGITYLATDMMLNRRVAIKEYFPREFAVREGTLVVRPAGNKEDRETFSWGLKRFLDEARVLALFDHPNIVAVRRFFESNGTAYLVMDYCDGVPLDELIKDKGPLNSDQLNRLLIPILDGLERVHNANFLHRDIKPANIFIRSDGSPVLLDFGAARQEVVSHSKSVTSLATPGYAAFEQYSTHGKQGPWTDIYGLGATLYRAISGEKPQDAPDRILEDALEPLAVKSLPGFDAKLLRAIDAAMEVRPNQRPQSIQQWRSQLGIRTPEVKQIEIQDQKTVVISAPIPAVTVKQPQIVGATLKQISDAPSEPRVIPNGALKPILIGIAVVATISVGYVALSPKTHDESSIKPTAVPVPIAASNERVASPPVQQPVDQSQNIPSCIGANTSLWTNCLGTQTFDASSKWAGQKYVGTFVDGKRSGDGTYTWPNGDKYIGQFKNNAPNGAGTFTWSDGTSYIGSFKDGLKHGYGTQTLLKGGKYVGEYRNDLMDGRGTLYKPDGSVAIKGSWVGGQFQSQSDAPPKTEMSVSQRMSICTRAADEMNKTPGKQLDKITVFKSASCYLNSGVPTFVYTYGVLGDVSTIGQQQIASLLPNRIKEWCANKELKPLLDMFEIQDRYLENSTGKFLGQNSFGAKACTR